MATPQMRQVSSGTASCPHFLTNFGIRAGTLTFVAFIQPTFSLPGRMAPEQRSIFTFHKKNGGFFSPPFKTQFQIILCSSAQVSPANFSVRERVKCGTGYTHTHTCTQNPGKVALHWRRHCICRWLRATRVQWQS